MRFSQEKEPGIFQRFACRSAKDHLSFPHDNHAVQVRHQPLSCLCIHLLPFLTRYLGYHNSQPRE
jgi:hypothetical protein